MFMTQIKILVTDANHKTIKSTCSLSEIFCQYPLFGISNIRLIIQFEILYATPYLSSVGHFESDLTK